MMSPLEAFLRSQVKNPKAEEIAEILDVFEERTYAKGEVFKEAYTLAKEVGFICSGSAQIIIVKHNGEESLGRLLPTGHFLLDFISARSGEETPIAIRFKEASVVMVASHSRVKSLLETNLALNIMVREYTADRTVELGKWLMLYQIGSAKDRYQFILENNPKLLNRLPLRLIASMIGITPTQLSRIRKKK